MWKCPFCLRDGKKSKEHLLSKPICQALGVDRTMTITSFDLNTGTASTTAPLDQRAVRLPCESCNSGWMSQLESDTARTLRRWLSDPKQKLTNAGLTHVVRWLAKTSFVLGFAEGDSRRFIETPTEVMVPDVTTARRIAEGASLDHVHAGAAKVAATNHIWGTGNASVSPTGPDRVSTRAVNVTALNLGQLQLWVVIPWVKPESVRLPAGVARLHGNLRSGSLMTRDHSIVPSLVTAYYPVPISSPLRAA